MTNILDNYIQAIQNYKKFNNSPFNYHCDSIYIVKNDFDSFFSSNKNQIILLDAIGSGMVSWYLCRYQKELYFVFDNYSSSSQFQFTARTTSYNELNKYLRLIDN